MCCQCSGPLAPCFMTLLQLISILQSKPFPPSALKLWMFEIFFFYDVVLKTFNKLYVILLNLILSFDSYLISVSFPIQIILHIAMIPFRYLINLLLQYFSQLCHICHHGIILWVSAIWSITQLLLTYLEYLRSLYCSLHPSVYSTETEVSYIFSYLIYQVLITCSIIIVQVLLPSY